MSDALAINPPTLETTAEECIFVLVDCLCGQHSNRHASNDSGQCSRKHGQQVKKRKKLTFLDIEKRTKMYSF